MSQVADIVIDANPTGLAMRTEINSINGAFNSSNKGGSAPGSIEAGAVWIDDTNDPIWDYFVYDGTTSIKICKIDTTNNIIIYDGVETESLQRALSTITSTSNATTVDMADANVFKHVFTEDTTFTFSNPPASGKNGSFILFLEQDGTGRTPTWPASVVWDTGSAPDLTVISAKYIVKFYTNDGGTIWFGEVVYTSVATAGGVWNLLDTQTASASTFLEFKTGITSTYDTYVIIFEELIPATDDVRLRATISRDGGSTYLSTGYQADFAHRAMGGAGGVTNGGAASAAFLELNEGGNGVGNAARESISGQMIFDHPSSATLYPAGEWACRDIDSGNAGNGRQGWWFSNLAPAAYDAIKLAFSSGNITSGRAMLYGISNT